MSETPPSEPPTPQPTPAPAPARGVEIDCLCLYPAQPREKLRGVLEECAAPAGFRALKAIDEILLNSMMEWLLPGERCMAASNAVADWQLIYDTDFSHAALANALSNALPECLIVQFNLQEQYDFTLRVLRDDNALYEYSNSPSFFNWGRCLGQAEATRIQRPDAPALAQAVGQPAATETLADFFSMLEKAVQKRPAASTKKTKRNRTVYDAVQSLARNLGMPKPYRFFEGWMRSDLDWAEDNIVDVLALRQG